MRRIPAIPLPGPRRLAALFATGVGAAHIASLWLRPLDVEAVWSLLQGIVYLFIALGLFGSSRLTLYLGIGLPALAAAVILHYTTGEMAPRTFASLISAALLTLFCTAALWRARDTGEP